jgi:hypothetical protein
MIVTVYAHVQLVNCTFAKKSDGAALTVTTSCGRKRRNTPFVYSLSPLIYTISTNVVPKLRKSVTFEKIGPDPSEFVNIVIRPDSTGERSGVVSGVRRSE